MKFRTRRSRGGFTLIELLVVISIIALLISILLPSLAAAREKGKVVKCLANLRSQAQAVVMYLDDDEEGVLRWYTVPGHPGYTFGTRTPSVFGGFKGPVPMPEPGYSVRDGAVYPAEVRPLNRLMAPELVGNSEIDHYKCPSDRSYKTGTLGQQVAPEDEDNPYTSWQVRGSSYPLNTRFMQGYVYPSLQFSTGNQAIYARRIAPHMIGGKASHFLLWLEQGHYSAAQNAGPVLTNSVGPRRQGWHHEFSKWAAAFADGSATYRYFDTRFHIGPGWTTWQPK